MTEELEAEVVHQHEHETWSRCADDYLDGFAGLTREGLPLLVEAAGIVDGHHVLDVGSGPGHIAEALTQAGSVVTGIDFSASMIDVARRRYPHINFEEAVAEQLPFEDATFDAVVSNFVVHHMARPEAAFQEISRVLKPGGRFSFTVFGNPAEQSSIGAFFAAVEIHHSIDELPHGPLFGVTDLGVYKRMLEAGGLSDPRFAFRNIIWREKSPDPVVASFLDWGNMATLPQETQDKIEASTRANLRRYKVREGEYALPHEILLGSARRQ